MPIKVCYVAGREAGYSRTRNVRLALQTAGFEVTLLAPKGKSKLHHPRLILQMQGKLKEADVILVGFYGQLLMPFARLLTGKPIVFDVYAATHSTLVEDRRVIGRNNPLSRLFWLADHLALRCADRVVLDTQHQIRIFAGAYDVDIGKFRRIFLCSDESVMRPGAPAPAGDTFRVHFHGEFAPFHGVDVILRAAHLLRDQGVSFTIIGTGITYERDRRLARELDLPNVRFIDRVPYAELARYMSQANACLGIFADSARAARELTNKVVEAMAVGRPLITRDNASVREVLADGDSALLVEPGSPEQLAQAILRLKADPALCERLGRNALEQYRLHCSQSRFAQDLGETIRGVLQAGVDAPSRLVK
jgi:glycosyltransferase involved in cell wall biosynthesis